MIEEKMQDKYIPTTEVIEIKVDETPQKHYIYPERIGEICYPEHKHNNTFVTVEMLMIDENTTRELTCDCSSIVFFADLCTCNDPHFIVKTKPNE